MPSKANCLADEDGIKTFAGEALCGGSKGSCILNPHDDPNNDDPYEWCIDVNQHICELVYTDVRNTSFKTGECNTTKYNCCSMEDGDEFLSNTFTKNDCYSRGGILANEIVCIGY